MKILVTCELKQGVQRRPAIDAAWDIDSEHLSTEALDEISSTLSDLGHEVTVISAGDLLTMDLSTFRGVCVNLAVGPGRDPSTKVYVAALLDMLSIPYIGSPPHALAFTRHKAVAKGIASMCDIPTPEFHILHPGDTIPTMEWRAIVKPLYESCSIGIHSGSVVEAASDANRAAERIWTLYEQPALVEQYIEGVDVEVPLLWREDALVPLGAVAVVPRLSDTEHRILTSATVYRDAYDFRDPGQFVARWSAVRRELKAYAVAFARLAGIRDYGRVDFRVTPEGKAFFLEASTHPYIARHSSFEWLFARHGMGYREIWRDLLASPRFHWTQSATESDRSARGSR
jgi:D-alanine-D-alanine ligase